MSGTSVQQTGQLGVAGMEWVIKGVGDVDGDGKKDLLWQNSTAGLTTPTTYAWLMNGVSIQSANGQGAWWVPGPTTTTIVYDGDGGRVTKTVGTQTTTYIGKLYVCGGTACAKMIFAGGQRIAIKQVGSGSTSYFHPDHLGSTNVLTNGSGVKEEDLVYYSYGDTFTNAGTANVAYKYTGKELDGSTGLYFYEARYYDAVLGRFISADTIVPNPGNPQDFNRYTYGNNNPILFNDPTGRFGIKSITNAFKKATRKLKNTLGSPGFTVLSFGIQVGIVPVPFLSPIQSGILGTGLLTQSKSGRYVLAGEIIVGTAVASWYCGGCAAVEGAAIGSAITGGFVAYSAYQNGGDISKGLLFGAATGAATGALNGWATGKFNFSSIYSGSSIFGARILAGAIAGAAGGSTVGYAGGVGSGGDILHGAFHGAIVGAVVAGALTGVDALGGIPITVETSPQSSDGNFSYQFGKVTVITKEAMQALSQIPSVSSLAVSGASGYDVLTNGKLSDFIIRKGGEKGGHGSCSGTFDDPKCGIGPGNP